MKKPLFFISVASLTLFVLIFSWFSFRQNRTFRINLEDPSFANEQIQPIFGTVTITVEDQTTSKLVFTDVDTMEKIEVDNLTLGHNKHIVLKRNHWYNVSGIGSITITIVNVRIP